MQKVLAIFGGPRRRRNTEKLLNMFLECVDPRKASIETVVLGELNISACTSCYGCSSSGICVIADDMTELYKKIKSSDIIVFASPIYFGNVPAAAKSMIDRCQAFWSAKYIAKIRGGSKRKGYFIATAGSDDSKAFDGAVYTVRLFFAACDAAYEGDVLIGNTDKIQVEDNRYARGKAVSLCRKAGIEGAISK